MLTASSRALAWARAAFAAALVTLPPAGARAQETTAAEPPSKQACFDSHAASQELRLEGSLIEARGELRVCVDASCPGVLRAECAEWLAQVEQAVPSVVFLVERDNDEVTDVRVSVDGRPLTDKLDGAAFELDPGAHRFKFELAGLPPITQTVVLRQSEKRRAVRVEFRSPTATAPGSPDQPATTATGPGPAPSSSSRPVPALTYVFGGLALAAAGVGAYLGLDAMGERNDREAECAPNCAEAVVDDIKAQLLIADILGGVAIASGTVSAIVFFTRPAVPDERPANGSNSLRLARTPPRLGITVTGAF